MQLNVHFELLLKNNANPKTKAFLLQVDFDSYANRTVIFGPSGCGKSVTLQAIAGLIKPAKGVIKLNQNIFFDKEKSVFMPARKRRIGYVFQDYALFPHLTVLENAGYSLKKWPGPLSGGNKMRVMEMLENFGIAELAKHFPHQISGGQRQRVALIRALLQQPEILLLDEPFSAMDILLRIKMRNELKNIQEKFNIPIVMITHDLEDVKIFADTLVVYRQGAIASVFDCQKINGAHSQNTERQWEEIFAECKKSFDTI